MRRPRPRLRILKEVWWFERAVRRRDPYALRRAMRRHPEMSWPVLVELWVAITENYYSHS